MKRFTHLFLIAVLGTIGFASCEKEGVAGPTGPQGTAGAQGSPGETGAPGPKGDSGVTGNANVRCFKFGPRDSNDSEEFYTIPGITEQNVDSFVVIPYLKGGDFWFQIPGLVVETSTSYMVNTALFPNSAGCSLYLGFYDRSNTQPAAVEGIDSVRVYVISTSAFTNLEFRANGLPIF